MEQLIKFLDENLKDKLSFIHDDIKEYITPELKSFCKERQEFNNTYNRIKLYTCSTYEIILICWNINSFTPIHDHAENGCSLHILDGDLEETVYNKQLEKIENVKMTGYMENSIGYHKIFSHVKTTSLHIYSPPNYVCLQA